MKSKHLLSMELKPNATADAILVRLKLHYG